MVTTVHNKNEDDLEKQNLTNAKYTEFLIVYASTSLLDVSFAKCLQAAK